MRYAIVLLIMLVGISAETSAQTYGLDNTNPAVFSKFTIPKTELSALWFNTNLNYYSHKNSNLFPTGQNSNYLNTNLSGSLDPQYYLLKESDSKYLRINANVSGNYQHSYTGNEGPGVSGMNYYYDNSDSWDLNASESYRDYFQGDNLFWSVSSIASLYISDGYHNSATSDSTRSTVYSGRKNQDYSFSIGAGWGKMRNVTSVVSAIRFQERMKQLNLINSDLSEKAIEDLAQEFYRQGYYSAVHVRPDKFFWQDVQNTLAADGVSLKGLNQYADSYLREVPNELKFMRNEGVVYGIQLNVAYSNTYGSANSYPFGISEQLMTLGNAYVEFSHQLNLNSQLNFNVSLSGGPNLSGNPQVWQEYDVSAGIRYDYELTDRVVVSADNSFGVTFQNSALHGRSLSNGANVQLNYFVEDNVSLSGNYSWNYFDLRGWNGSQSHIRNINNQVSVGFTYYIDRGFIYK